MADQKAKPGGRTLRSRYALLFFPTIMLLDFYGLLFGGAGQYGPMVATAGLLSFGCGAAMGICLYKKRKLTTAWSPCYWLIFGLIGSVIPIFLFFYLPYLLLRTRSL
jgi:hypothetical protein